MHRQLLAAALVSVLAPAATGQTVFDHFTGNRIDQQRWWPWGDHSSTTVSNSLLQLRLTGPTTGYPDNGIVSMAAFRGDFDFVLDFANFKVTGTGPNDGALKLRVMGIDNRFDQENAIDVEIRENPHAPGRWFQVKSYRNSKDNGRATLATTAVAGELRIRRVRAASTVYAMVRPFGQRAWQTLMSWPDWFPAHTYVEIVCNAPGPGRISVDSDKIAALSGTIPSPTIYGTGCHGLSARPWGLPYRGNLDFGIYISDTAGKHPKAPLFFLVGFKAWSIDLTGAGAPGCWLLAAPDLIGVAGILDDDAITYIPIPNLNIVGLNLYMQHVAFSSQNAFGWAFANGSHATIY